MESMMAKTWPFLLGLVLIVAAESIAAQQPKPERVDPNAAARSLELSVVERGTKRPLAGVTIRSPSYRDGAKEFRGTTDNLGRTTVPMPPREAGKTLWVDLFAEGGPKEGATVRARCRKSVQMPPGPERVPLDLGVITLDRVEEPANHP
jgi:hypothetical protein